MVPKTTSNSFPIFSASSGNVFAEVHSDLSFKIIITSPASIGIGSVGTSPLPILETIFMTSGNLLFKIADAFVALSMLVFKLLPGNTLISKAKSPSSNAGINSPPKKVSVTIAETNNTITLEIISLG